MLDAYKELTPVVYGENSVKYLQMQTEAGKRCFCVHWHERIELMQISEGTLILQSEDGQCEIRAGQVVVCSPRRLHGGIAGESGVSFRTIMFDVDKFCNNTPASNKYLVPVVNGEIKFSTVVVDEDLDSSLNKLIEVLKREADYHPLIVEGIIYEILGVLFRYGVTPVEIPFEKNSNFQKVLEYVNEHFMENISLSKISDQFGYNETYFCRLFRKETGFTFTKYIQTMRMEYALKLLEEGKEEVRHIAWKCGYSDVSYFSNCFKKYFGFRPTALINK